MKTARLLMFAGLGFLMLTAAGCKPPWPKCKTSDQCKTDDKGQVKNFVCVQGTCKECGADTDCKTGFICRENACVPKPECETNTDCTGGMICKNEKCVPECTADTDCAEGMKCQASKCVPKAECTTNADCPSGKECSPDGKCVTAAPTCQMQTVHFDFNSYDLTGDARSTLEQDATCLKQRANQPVVLAGYCDNRGTEEYNLALGNKRANAVKKYLSDLGVDGSRMKTVSYGKERPVCTQNTEDCWAQNRRVEFELEAAPAGM
jgi:peptidoglycan-associated lipoprotein